MNEYELNADTTRRTLDATNFTWTPPTTKININAPDNLTLLEKHPSTWLHENPFGIFVFKCESALLCSGPDQAPAGSSCEHVFNSTPGSKPALGYLESLRALDGLYNDSAGLVVDKWSDALYTGLHVDTAHW